MIRTKLYALSVFSLVGLVGLIWFSLSYSQRIDTLNDYFEREVEPRSRYLNEMLFSFGYGHAIHNFKNLVKRGAEDYVERLALNQEQFNDSLDSYIRLLNEGSEARYAFDGYDFYSEVGRRHERERESLKQIQVTFNEYLGWVDDIQDLYQQDKSVAEIDQHVQVNDDQAILASSLSAPTLMSSKSASRIKPGVW